MGLTLDWVKIETRVESKKGPSEQERMWLWTEKLIGELTLISTLRVAEAEKTADKAAKLAEIYQYEF